MAINDTTYTTRRLTVRIWEIEHAGDLNEAYGPLNATKIPFIVHSERINEDSEVATVEIELRDDKANEFIASVRNSEDGELYVFGIER